MSVGVDELRRRLDGIRNLPTLPTVLQKVQTLARDPAAGARDIGAVVAQDSVLTARILKMVNSAFYGISREISSMDQAVVVLGLRDLEQVILATTVLKIFPGNNDKSAFDMTEFWKHALGTAIISRELSSTLRIGDPIELFTMGLLHDLGKLVLDLFFYEQYKPVLVAARTGSDPIGVIEQEMLEFTHADVGAILAAKWELPMRLVDVIQHHHTPTASEVGAPEAAIINLADMLCRAKDWGDPGDPHVPALAEGVRELAPLRVEQVAPLMGRIEEQYRDGLALIDIR